MTRRSKRLLVRGGTVIDPASGRHGPFDVLLAGDRVQCIATPGEVDPTNAECLDATGCWVTPGLIDMHVHLREPGFEYRETIASGVAAAVAGGFTAVACMANTDPVNDSGAVTEFILDRARQAGLARVYPIGALSVGLRGEKLAEIGEMHRAGIVAVSDDGHAVNDGALMRRALEYCGQFAIPVIAHEEDGPLAAGGVMNEGAMSFRLGLHGMPAAAEDVMVARDLALVELTEGRLHIAHVSTAGSVQRIREAKRAGLPVTAEVTPHHLTLTEAAVAKYETNARMKPPLRTAADVDAVLEGLADGTIDAIATDHAPHHRDEKDVEFAAAADGVVGLETAVSVVLGLLAEHDLEIDTLIRAMSTAPARILGLDAGQLVEGGPADVTVIDPRVRRRVNPEGFSSLARNTPFAGRETIGAAVLTIVAGRVVWRSDEVSTEGDHA